MIEDSDDNDDETPTLTVSLASEENQDCEESADNEESATDSKESATDFVPLPVAISDLTQQSSSGTQLNDIGKLISSST